MESNLVHTPPTYLTIISSSREHIKLQFNLQYALLHCSNVDKWQLTDDSSKAYAYISREAMVKTEVTWLVCFTSDDYMKVSTVSFSSFTQLQCGFTSFTTYNTIFRSIQSWTIKYPSKYKTMLLIFSSIIYI